MTGEDRTTPRCDGDFIVNVNGRTFTHKFAEGFAEPSKEAPVTREATCCEFACYENPGCSCDGCRAIAPAPAPDRTMLPTQLIRCEWPPNDGVKPGDPQFDSLLAAIRADGYIREPLTINLSWHVIDGNHRLAAARLLGITHVPVRVWTGVEFVQ